MVGLGLTACDSEDDGDGTASGTVADGGAGMDGGAENDSTGAQAEPQTIECGGMTCMAMPAPAQIAMFAPGDLAPCCTDMNTCGADLSALSALAGAMGGGMLPTCGDPNTLLGDGGAIGGEDETIYLDENCNGLQLEAVGMTIPLPGCCDPSGQCGGSTEALAGLAMGIVDIAMACATESELEDALSGSPAAGLATVSVPEGGVGGACDYPGPDPDAGADGG